MPKEENSNPSPSVEPVLPTVDPSVLAASEPQTTPVEETASTATAEPVVPVAEPTPAVEQASAAPTPSASAKPAKKSRKPRTKKTEAKATAIKTRQTKAKPVVLEPIADQTSHSQAKPARTHTSPVILALLVVSLLVSCASLSYCIWDFVRGDTPITFNHPGADGNDTSFTEGSIAEIASKVTPGVVSIVTEVKTTGFFGQTSTSTAAGTGMIVTKDGYVLTNKHVIEGANSIQIVLDDGTTYSDIAIVGQDPSNDVAFLKIKNVNDLPTVELGDSKTITAGQQVIAVGNALGQFQNTITSGIISGTGRAITATSSDYSSSENLTDMIQTDAAINAGNSGGPLVNAAGQVIGINTATSSDADGIGFAIPISSVKGMLKNIINNNSSDRAYLGIYYVSITPDVAKAYNLPVSSGAYVYSPSQYSSIVVNGPAAKAGLKEKDIITKINGIAVGKSGSVSTLIGEYAPGDTVQLTVIREGKERAINVTLGSYNN